MHAYLRIPSPRGPSQLFRPPALPAGSEASSVRGDLPRWTELVIAPQAAMSSRHVQLLSSSIGPASCVTWQHQRVFQVAPGMQLPNTSVMPAEGVASTTQDDTAGLVPRGQTSRFGRADVYGPWARMSSTNVRAHARWHSMIGAATKTWPQCPLAGLPQLIGAVGPAYRPGGLCARTVICLVTSCCDPWCPGGH
jgi:hypothetical protein